MIKSDRVTTTTCPYCGVGCTLQLHVKDDFIYKVTSPFDSTADALTVLSLAALAVMAYAAWKKRLPLPWVAFSVVIIALMLIPETVTARPRFVFTAFPLFIAVAAWWPQAPRVKNEEDDSLSWERQSWNFVLITCGAGLAVLTNLYAVFGAIP